MADLTADDVARMTTPTWEHAKNAIRAGDTDRALSHFNFYRSAQGGDRA